MLNNPNVEVLIDKLSDGKEDVSRYALCVLASKRAREIIYINARDEKQTENSEKELTIACQEIAEGKVGIAND